MVTLTAPMAQRPGLKGAPSKRSFFFPTLHEELLHLGTAGTAAMNRAASYFKHPAENVTEDDPLHLGFDMSTQALKVVAVNDRLEVIGEASCNFSSEMPEYKTDQGVHVYPGGVINAPVEMYIKSMDILLDKLSLNDFPFERVKTISGAGQQHAMVLFSNDAASLLGGLKPEKPLWEQLSGAFSSPTVTNWQDSSTTDLCDALEASLPGGAEELAQISGSKAHTRFTGLQLAKALKESPDMIWSNTSRVAVVSNFLATLLCADKSGVRGMDEADAGGSNMYDLNERKWSEKLIGKILAISGAGKENDQQKIARIEEMLGPVELDPSRAVGKVGHWFQERYGFSEDCEVVPFSGDNPATLLAFSLRPGDAIVSLGTSDTVLLATESYKPSPNYHVFAHPGGTTDSGNRAYMAMLCYKNGSLPRERIRDTYGNKTWEGFNKLASDHEAAEEIGFYFDKTEIIPFGVDGTHLFDSKGKSVTEFENKDVHPAAILGSQFLSFRSRIEELLPKGEERLDRIFVAGGGSVNPVITQYLADVLGASCYVATGGAQGCAGGAASRAAWSHARKGDSSLTFSAFVENARRGIKGSTTKAEEDSGMSGMKRVSSSREEMFVKFGDLLGPWKEAEKKVMDACVAQK